MQTAQKTFGETHKEGEGLLKLRDLFFGERVSLRNVSSVMHCSFTRFSAAGFDNSGAEQTMIV